MSIVLNARQKFSNLHIVPGPQSPNIRPKPAPCYVSPMATDASLILSKCRLCPMSTQYIPIKILSSFEAERLFHQMIELIWNPTSTLTAELVSRRPNVRTTVEFLI